MIFVKWTGQGFVQQAVSAVPDKILTPEGWKTAAEGPIGQNIFSVVSISLTWAVNPPWPLLLAATFHDHFCPGVNAGYVAAEYCRDKMPLRQGEQYKLVKQALSREAFQPLPVHADVRIQNESKAPVEIG